MVAAILVGLPSLRLRADYFAITTLAFSEIVRYLTDNTRSLTNGSQGLLGYSGGWVKLSVQLGGWLNDHGIHVTSFLFPLLLVSWALFIVLALLVAAVVRTPWGRLPRAREEHARVQAAVTRTVRGARRDRGVRPRAQPDPARAGRVRSRLHDLRLRDRDPRRARELLRRARRLRRPDDAARRYALRRAAAGGGQGRRDPLHPRRRRPHPADGVPAAGDLRQEAGDAARSVTPS